MRLLALLLCLVTSASAQPARYFHHIGLGPRVTAVLNESPVGGSLRAVEITAAGTPVTGDTLTLWIKHCPPAQCAWPEESDTSDLLVSCYPSALEPSQRSRHVFPDYTGEVWVYQSVDGDFVVTPGRARDRMTFFVWRGAYLPHYRHSR